MKALFCNLPKWTLSQLISHLSPLGDPSIQESQRKQTYYIVLKHSQQTGTDKHLADVLHNIVSMHLQLNFSLAEETYSRQSGVLCNPRRGVINGFLQLQVSSTQNLPKNNVPFLPRRLPCEKVELMLQRHRRHPWCMWSGCQRPHFLLSGLKWIGQTQILAQPVVDIPLWACVGRITEYPASQCLKCLLGPLLRCQPGLKLGLIEQ